MESKTTSVDYYIGYFGVFFTYNRKRFAELVTKFSGIAFSRLLFRRLIDYSVGFWYNFWCFVSIFDLFFCILV